MRLTHDGTRFVALSRYGEWQAKEAGFRWDPAAKVWWTDDMSRARRLAMVVDVESTAYAILGPALDTSASRATDSDIDIPAPEGLSYLPFQRAGVAYAATRPNVLIADEMGLGKTIQALGIANSDERVRRILVVCPASLKLNWRREAERWLVIPRPTVVINGSIPAPIDGDDLVAVINYDVLAKHADALRARTWDLLIVDEAHYLKNPQAQRTQQVLGAAKKNLLPLPARRRVFLTGTPIVNRPAELWPLLQALDPSGLGRNWRAYHTRYAAAHQTRWGWDTSGASNLPELQSLLRQTCMVRRLKSEVLTELPPKRRQLIPITPSAAYAEAEAEALQLSAVREFAANGQENYEEAVARLQGEPAAFSQVSALRKLAALEKLPTVLALLDEYVEAGTPVLVFAHHHEVVDTIAAHVPGASVVDGRTPVGERMERVDRFQRGETDVFIGSIGAAGVGLTLTRAATVLFAELDWVPGNVAQAEDRAHRIGQQQSVNVLHVVLDETLDARLAQTIVRKASVIDRALDAGAAQPQVVDPEVAPVRKSAPGAAPAQPEVAPETMAAIHQALRVLAGLDTDRAREVNGIGFNKLDGDFGHDLAARERLSPRQALAAAKMLRKYRRQLPDELYEALCATYAK